MRNVRVWKHRQKEVYFQSAPQLNWLAGKAPEKVFQCNWVSDVSGDTPVCQIPTYWLKHPVSANFIEVNV